MQNHMKLAEGLVLRADAKRRIERLRERLKSAALVQEGEEPPENPNDLLDELTRLLQQTETLIERVNRTNLQAVLQSGTTLTAALAKRDILSVHFAVLETTATAATPKFDRMNRSEIKKVPTIKVAELRRQMDDLARQRRELDTEIQAANWTVELLE